LTTTIIVKKKVVIPDPRADWPEHLRLSEDSALWSKLLTLAHRHSPQLARILEGFRTEGTRIVKLKNGNFGLRPVIRPAGSDNPDEGWRDEADYKEYAKKFLAPWHNTLVKLLEELKEAAEAGNEEERQIALEI
jgi:hypothetical protein